MHKKSFRFWPRELPRELVYPQTSFDKNLSVSALRYPDRCFIDFTAAASPMARPSGSPRGLRPSCSARASNAATESFSCRIVRSSCSPSRPSCGPAVWSFPSIR